MHLTSLCIIQLFFCFFFYPYLLVLLGACGLCSLCLAPLLFWMGAFPVMEESKKGHLHLKCFWIFSVAEKYSFFDDIEENVFIYVQIFFKLSV